MPLSVTLVNVSGQRFRLELPQAAPTLLPAALYEAAGARLGLQQGRFKLLRGGALVAADSKQPVALSEGDTLVVVPQRRAPTEAAQAAAAEALGVAPPDEDDAPIRFRLQPGAPAWHGHLARFLQHTCHVPDLALAWLFTLGPGRLLVFGLVLAGARVANGWGLGSIYLMIAILVGVWTNLGDRREGEASAYRWVCLFGGWGWGVEGGWAQSLRCPNEGGERIPCCQFVFPHTPTRIHPHPHNNCAASSTLECAGFLDSWMRIRLMSSYGEGEACSRGLMRLAGWVDLCYR